MRLFVALNFSDAFRAQILAVQSELRRQSRPAPGRRINWTREENLHLTLAFIGEQKSPSEAEKTRGEVRCPPFTLTAGKPFLLGSVCCLGLGGTEGGELSALVSSVRDALGSHGVPFDPKPFRAHITLAREYRGPLPSLPDFAPEGPAERVGDFALMLSDREGENGRLRYTPLSVFPLYE